MKARGEVNPYAPKWSVWIILGLLVWTLMTDHTALPLCIVAAGGWWNYYRAIG